MPHTCVRVCAALPPQAHRQPQACILPGVQAAGQGTWGHWWCAGRHEV